MTRGRGLRTALATAALATALPLAACGSGGDPTSSTDETAAGGLSDSALPEEPVSNRADGFADAVTGGDCEEIAEYAFVPAIVPDPDNPTDKAGCRALEAFADPLAGITVDGTEAFGTGAVSDGTVEGKNWSVNWIDDNGATPGGDYRAFSYVQADPQVGVEPVEGADFAGTASSFVAALRDHDCHAAWDAFGPDSPPKQNDEQSFCAGFDDEWFGDDEALGTLLTANPDIEPVELGGSLDGVFYGIPVDPYRTLFVITDPGRPGAMQETGTGVFATFKTRPE